MNLETQHPPQPSLLLLALAALHAADIVRLIGPILVADKMPARVAPRRVARGVPKLALTQ
ncbi:MAG: hypothetical protein EBU32_06015 [Opitutaceae bacterium]|nr:hypothetical protein [Opitutaceae bacterium]